MGNEAQAEMRFRIALSRGDLNAVERLLRAGHKPPKGCVSLAVGSGNEKLAIMLLERGMATDRDKNYTLTVAVEEGRWALAERLLAAGGSPNADWGLNRIPLISIAVAKGNSGFVRKLIALGVSPNSHEVPFSAALLGTPIGQTVLMVAAEKGDMEMTRLLLEAGANPWTKGEKNKTAYELVTKRANRKEVAALLLDWMQKHPAKSAAPAAAPAPDLTTSFTSWSDAVSRLESLTAAKSAPHPRAKAIVRFVLSPETARTLAGLKAVATAGRKLIEVHRAALASVQRLSGDLKVCWFLQFEPRQGVFICALPKGDQWKVHAALKPACANFGVTHAALVKFLKGLDADHPFDLVDCDEQSVGGRFSGKLTKPVAVAERLHAFCPFVADDHGGDVKRFAKELAKTGHFKLWWD